MSVSFVKALTAGGWGYGGGPITSPSFTPTNAGDAIAVWWQNETTDTITVSGTGTYTSLTGTYDDPVGDNNGAAINLSCSSAAQTATVTSSGTYSFPYATALEYSGVGSASSFSGTNSVNPGTGTGAVQGTSVTVPSGAVLIAICYVYVAGAPTITPAGGGTTRDSHTSPNWTLAEWAGSGAAITPSFTVSGGTLSYAVVQFMLSPPAVTPCVLLQPTPVPVYF